MFREPDLELMRFQLYLSMAKKTLKITRDTYLLGSCNISPISHPRINHRYAGKPTWENKKLDTLEGILSDQLVVSPTLFNHQHPKKRNTLDALLDTDLKKLTRERLEKSREDIVAFAKELVKKNDNKDSNEKIKRGLLFYSYLSKKSAQMNVGNCSELAAFAFLLLLKSGYMGRAELMSFLNRDHDFVILNRPEGTDDTNWETWGPQTIILEAWLNKTFTADKFGHVWRKKLHLTGLTPNQAKTTKADFTLDYALATYVKCNDNIVKYFQIPTERKHVGKYR